MAILNDKQSINFPMDYPKFDHKAAITHISVCKGMTAQLGYVCLFQDHFSNLKKFASQLLKLQSLDEVILRNDVCLDQYFSDQNGSNQPNSDFLQRICLLYSPLRATQCQAFQCKQEKEEQFRHQLHSGLNLVFMLNSGVNVAQVPSELDIKQLLPILEMILSQESSVSGLVNQWLNIVVKQHIGEPKFIESMFHVFTNSMRACRGNQRANPKVNAETIDLLRELGYQLLDERNENSKQLHETFFKCLVQSTDFWINQSVIKENVHTLNEQYWLLIKYIYSQYSFEYNEIFPVQILIILMNEIGLAFTQANSGGAP